MNNATDRQKFTLDLSADYQQAKLIPYWSHSPQPGPTYYMMKHSNNIFGIIDHREDSAQTYIFGEEVGPKNTDHTISFLQKYLQSVQKKNPWLNRVLLFLDNATSTNKNKYLILWAKEMVEQKKLSSIQICFLVAGPTKFSPDRLFASCSKTYNCSDVFNQEDLGSVYSRYNNTSISQGEDINSWRECLQSAEVKGIRTLHKFFIVQTNDDVVVRVGEKSYDSTTLKTINMNKTGDLPSLTNYSETIKSLGKDKLGHLKQMCEKYIPRSRWPHLITSSTNYSTAGNKRQALAPINLNGRAKRAKK